MKSINGTKSHTIYAAAALSLAAAALPSQASAQAPAAPPAPPAPPAAAAPAAATVAAPAPGQAVAAGGVEELNRRVAELEQQQRALQERLDAERRAAAEAAASAAARQAQAAKDKAGEASVTAAPGKGFTVKTADGGFSSTIRARVQIRETFTHTDEDDTHEINVRTVRLTTNGHFISPDLKYNVQLAFGGNDFERDSPSPIFDAFVEYTGIRDLNVRVGQFLAPFDRARTLREVSIQQTERPIAVREFNLDRDVGLMVSSPDLFGLGGKLSYNLFLGGGEGRNRFGAQEHGPLAVARLAVRPFGAFDDDQDGDLTREAKPRLAVGVTGAYNHQTNRQNSTFGTTLTLGAADYLHGAADLVFKYAGFSLAAEAVARHAERDSFEGEADGAPVQEWTRSGYGYFAQAGYLLTDHLEVAARWDQIFAERGTDPKLVDLVAAQGKQVGGGLNYYLNGYALKVQGDYFYIFGEDASEGRHVARLQLDASF
ncbi:porin [Sorangium sp. So ce119]|uniref:porin n=1 Tax=Sorangium sp. So ce119 TaxID=3133279 RepID=UPI003F5E2795